MWGCKRGLRRVAWVWGTTPTFIVTLQFKYWSSVLFIAFTVCQSRQSRTSSHAGLESHNVTHVTGQNPPCHQPMPMNGKATHWPLVDAFKLIKSATTYFALESLHCHFQLLPRLWNPRALVSYSVARRIHHLTRLYFCCLSQP